MAELWGVLSNIGEKWLKSDQEISEKAHGIVIPTLVRLNVNLLKPAVVYSFHNFQYSDIMMSVMASQITSVSIFYQPFCSDADQRKHQSYTSLAFVRGIHQWPVDSHNKGPVMQKMFPFDEV